MLNNKVYNKEHVEEHGTAKCVDPENVRNFNKIIEGLEPEPKIVISSSWRTIYSFDELTDFLRTNNLKGQILGRTLTALEITGHMEANTTRQQEIKSTLESLKGDEFFENEIIEIDKHLILDDIQMTDPELAKNQVCTSFEGEGLTEQHVDKAIEILRGGG